MINQKLEQLIANNYNLPSIHKPILQLNQNAKILIIGPAPGIIAYNSGIPWNDASGIRLRSWLEISDDDFYDADKFALASMNFWYPGVDKNGNDNPPSLRLAEIFHRPILDLLPNIKLTLVIGLQAQIYMLKQDIKNSMTATVQAWREYAPDYMPLPHPSWHNTRWLKTNQWFENELLLDLRAKVRVILNAPA